MQHFFKRIECDRTFFTFYFNRLYTVEGVRFHVSVVGRDKKSYSLLMMQQDEGWVFVNSENCPEWITNAESKLSLTILEALSI